MGANKQYFHDASLAIVNRLEKLRRRGKKWKQLEALEKLKKQEGPFWASSIIKYNRIKDKAFDEEVRLLAEKCSKEAAIKSREALKRRFTREVEYVPLDKIHPSEIEEGKTSEDSSTYAILRDDISLKGILIPLLITDSGEIIDGHTRYSIAKELQIYTIPCMVAYLNSLPEHQRI
jgi:hypothetical protein